jgi:hypothetical protein
MKTTYVLPHQVGNDLALNESPGQEVSQMLRASISFFFLGLLMLGLGIYNIAGMSLELGRLLLFILLGLSVISFLGGVLTGRGGAGAPH